MKIKNIIFFLILIFFNLAGCRDNQKTISIFPLQHYDQEISDWIKPTDNDYDKSILSPKAVQHRLTIFYQHYIGTASPWNAEHVNKILLGTNSDTLDSIEQDIIKTYNNNNKAKNEIGYGENFRAYPEEWIHTIADNIHVTQFSHLYFDPNQCAIAIDNLAVRALPTDDVYFYHYTIAGQGYPFDNLQISALWAGTPIYILGETRDHAWALVLSPDYIGWVKNSGIARTNIIFINTWKKAALKKLAAITQTKTSMIDIINTQQIYRFSAYVGAVFPAEDQNMNMIKLYIPVADSKHNAVIHYALVSKTQAALIPLTTTPHHFSDIMRTLLGRPYGWGNMYFYNDCSSELKSLFTPFGIWLPRHSSNQMQAGRMIDLSDESLHHRLDYLMTKGRSFTTLIYVGGHVMLFIGNYPNPNISNHSLMPMTFQDMWGLKPSPPVSRAVIGQSVIFPILENYPEDSHLKSQASRDYFQLTQLDEVSDNLLKLQLIDLKELMYP